jgi:CxxC motif-containing protein (DUF1111 family)
VSTIGRNRQPECANRAVALLFIVATASLAACTHRGSDTSELLDPNSGGAATVRNTTRSAFSQPAPNIDVRRRAEFFMGNAFFNSAWVVAPASAAARDGLGPMFNARSCDACHNNDGRGQPPAREGERPVSLVFQFATPTPGSHNEPSPDPGYGGNLNPFAIGGVAAEGNVRVRYREIPARFADGERFALQAPEYAFEELSYGELAPGTTFSPRVAPAVFGSGLLAAVPEPQILERSDPDDRDRDGISGRPNRVWDVLTGQVALGRFGWKANQPGIAHQTAAAFAGEIGMSSALHPAQSCTTAQTACMAAPDGGKPEVSDEIFTHMVNYQRMLAVPARRNLESADVKRGAELFLASGCAACHRPTFVTGEDANEPWLSRQTIHPYTDLLLHDMGPDLADGRADFEASGSEWRTPALWGLGLQQAVNGHTRLLHDGRARDASEAILWHGGEAERARRAYRDLAKADRKALLAFLDSL